MSIKLMGVLSGAELLFLGTDLNKECGKVGARLQPLPHSLSQELFLMENEITWMVSEDPPTSQFSSLWFSPQCSVAVEMRAGSQLGPGYQHHAQPKRKKP